TTILVDLGSKKNAYVAGKDAVEFVRLLPTLVDSFGRNGLEILEVLLGGTTHDYDGAGILTRVLTPAKRAGRLVTFGDSAFGKADKPTWSYGGVNLYLLSVNVPKRNGADKNAKSIVLLVEYKSRKCILMGDAEGPTEGTILKNFDHDFLESEGLKLGHHGSEAGTTIPWIQAVKPAYVFASSDMKWAHPYCTTIERLQNEGTLTVAKKHPWLCGKGANASKQYFNHLDHDAIFTTLLFQKQLTGVTDDAEKATNAKIFKEYDPQDILPDGLVQGNQYRWTVLNNGNLEITSVF
ncbi:MAG: ComEC/Rec2 family competence protein, partial [Thermoanaerobaculia bacterium]